MSQAFLRDDAEGEMPRRNYGLPERDDPEFDRVAARALLEAARVGETQLAERATGYYWGEPKLHPYVETLRARPGSANEGGRLLRISMTTIGRIAPRGAIRTIRLIRSIRSSDATKPCLGAPDPNGQRQQG